MNALPALTVAPIVIAGDINLALVASHGLVGSANQQAPSLTASKVRLLVPADKGVVYPVPGLLDAVMVNV